MELGVNEKGALVLPSAVAVANAILADPGALDVAKPEAEDVRKPELVAPLPSEELALPVTDWEREAALLTVPAPPLLEEGEGEALLASEARGEALLQGEGLRVPPPPVAVPPFASEGV